MGLAGDLHQHRGSIVDFGRIALEQLARCHDGLVRRLAPATAASHAVCHHRQNAAIDPSMVEHCHPVLLIVSVSLVYTCGSGESVTFGHFFLAVAAIPHSVCVNTYYESRRVHRPASPRNQF